MIENLKNTTLIHKETITWNGRTVVGSLNIPWTLVGNGLPIGLSLPSPCFSPLENRNTTQSSSACKFIRNKIINKIHKNFPVLAFLTQHFFLPLTNLWLAVQILFPQFCSFDLYLKNIPESIHWTWP